MDGSLQRFSVMLSSLYFAPPHRVTRAKGFPFELSRRPRRRAPIKLGNTIQLSYQVLAVTVLRFYFYQILRERAAEDD
ncbi:hypothetical protein SAY86_024853 [Trapa natans]|uniref:Uncharacterized protein n=1 Tax=Trapa natans TaxID=22666 RepID=A0AAN7RK53_TRANT|nr:hypothetical protein SAY86_024853 [Trapa natans]